MEKLLFAFPDNHIRDEQIKNQCKISSLRLRKNIPHRAEETPTLLWPHQNLGKLKAYF